MNIFNPSSWRKSSGVRKQDPEIWSISEIESTKNDLGSGILDNVSLRFEDPHQSLSDQTLMFPSAPFKKKKRLERKSIASADRSLYPALSIESSAGDITLCENESDMAMSEIADRSNNRGVDIETHLPSVKISWRIQMTLANILLSSVTREVAVTIGLKALQSLDLPEARLAFLAACLIEPQTSIEPVQSISPTLVFSGIYSCGIFSKNLDFQIPKKSTAFYIYVERFKRIAVGFIEVSAAYLSDDTFYAPPPIKFLEPILGRNACRLPNGMVYQFTRSIIKVDFHPYTFNYSDFYHYLYRSFLSPQGSG